MKDDAKSREQLIHELAIMRQRAIAAEEQLAHAQTQLNPNNPLPRPPGKHSLIHELHVLHRITSASINAVDEDEFITQATDIIGKLVKTANYGIYLVRPENNDCYAHSSYHYGDPSLNEARGDQFVKQAIITQKPVLINHLKPPLTPTKTGLTTFTALCVPLHIENQMMGVIDVRDSQPDLLDETDKHLLTILANHLVNSLEKTRLIYKTRHRARQQQHLAETAHQMLTVLSLPELWSAMKTAVQQILDAERIAIYLQQEEGHLYCPYALGISTDYIEAISQHFHQMPDQQVFRHQQPVAVNDVAHNPITQNLRQLMLLEGFYAYAVFPLTAPTDDIIGSLAIYRDKPRPFTANDLETGNTLAQITAIALQNVQLFSEKHLALLREQQFNEMTRSLSQAHDLPTILANIVQMATALAQANTGALGLVIDDQTISYYPYNLPDKLILHPTRRGRGIAWHIVETGEPILLDNYADHPQAIQGWVDAGIRSFLGVPITAGNKRLGALGLFHMDSEKRFSQRDMALAESVGRHAGIAIQNTRLFAESQQRNEVLRTALLKQEELDNLKDMFIQNVSHELRTPLGLIYGHAALLESGDLGPLTELQHNSVHIIARRSQMLNNIVEDLIALLTTQIQQPKHEAIDMIQLIGEIAADFELKAAQANLTLQTDIAPDLPWIIGNPTYLRRVFDNLISNAFKFTQAGGTIYIRAWREETTLLIEVADTGIGIPEKQLQRIFERFYQVDGSTRRRYGGTGLGLALVYEIIQAHKGYIAVDSQEGTGTTFQIKLPGHEHVAEPIKPP